MAYGPYYNQDNKVVVDGDVILASDINAINSATESGFESVGTDFDTLVATTIPALVAPLVPDIGATNPLMDGSATPGVSGQVSDKNHVHPTDTSRAPLASPTFTGTVGGITKSMVGLGSVDNTTDANKPVSSATQSALDLKANLASPTFTGTVGGITKAMIGLDNVDNTTDANKPVSSVTQSALNLKANLASPTFTGTVVLPSDTAIGNVSSTEIGYVDGVTSAIQTQLNTKAALASPALTGVPTAPTATSGTSTTQIATTAFAAALAVPVGSIIAFSVATAPTGFLALPTAATDINRTTYANLFTAIGTTWGVGDSSTTFGMPYCPAGYTLAQGTAGTTYVGLVQEHSHSIYSPNAAASVGGAVVGHSGNTGATQLSSGANYAAAVNIKYCVKY